MTMATTQNQHTELTDIQMTLLRLFSRPMSKKETIELKRLLVEHYSHQLDKEVSRVVSEKKYDQKDFDDMLNGSN